MSHTLKRQTLCLLLQPLVFIATATTGLVVQNTVCPIITDTDYKGYYLQCFNQRLTLKDLPTLLHTNVTTLDLSFNDLRRLPSGVLKSFTHLRRLICIHCNLMTIESGSLEGLGKLEVLILSRNLLQIKYGAIPKGVFKHVPNLRKLYIDRNTNDMDIARYSDHIGIFKYLPNLTDLAIDSFRSLKINDEFLKFKRLENLQIYCKFLRKVSNDSFKGFENSTLKGLELINAKLCTHNLGLDMFQFLPNISYLKMDNFRIGSPNVLRLMKPLENRSIETIILSSVYFPHFSTLEQKQGDAFLTAKGMEYFGSICVDNFYWFDTHFFSIERDGLQSKTWRRCLRQFIFQSNQLVETDMNFFQLDLYQHLKLVSISITEDKLLSNIFLDDNTSSDYEESFGNSFVSDCLKSLVPFDRRSMKRLNAVPDCDGSGREKVSSKLLMKTKRSFRRWHLDSFKAKQKANSTFIENQDQDKRLSKPYKIFPRISEMSGELIDKNEFWEKGIEQRQCNYKNCERRPNFQQDGSGAPSISLPPSLEMLSIDGFHYRHMKDVLNFNANNSLNTFEATNGLYILTLRGRITGWERLSTINFEGTTLDHDLDFFQSFRSLKNLVLRKTAITSEFLETYCKGIVENIPLLEYLDIAENDLSRLAQKTFHTSKRLRYLSLEKNKFSELPFSLKDTPLLEVLDLRGNVFSELSLETRSDVDQHIKLVPNFTILLSHNILSCSCSVLPFIVWLRRNQAHFENNGNFSCVSDDGIMSYTAFHDDMAGFWRHCKGGYYLMLSLTMLCALLAGYSALFLGMKRKTQIISFFMRVFVPGFRLKSRQDFSTDVFIGYANQDVEYVRNVLLSYIEGLWHLRTFVHSRDLLTDPGVMATTLEDSWRCLFLITQNFLHNYEFAYNNMKVASYFVGPTNPKRVVLIVEERVQHRLPAYLLHVVDEDNILIVPHLQGSLDDQALDTLRTRLMT